MEQIKAQLVLEDGRVFKGYSFGAEGERFGEVVFNTSMTGYQEILTDPSYKGQMVCMTYPLIGNYGINDEDVESRKPFLEAFIIKELSRISSNWRSRGTLSDYLADKGVVGIQGVDTRALTRHIRREGAMKAVVSTIDTDKKKLLEKVRASKGLVGVDLVKDVTYDKPFEWNKSGKGKYNVVALDCGIKFNILRLLEKHGCRVTVMPAHTGYDEIMSKNPDGIMLSNGPGDPAEVENVPGIVKKLFGKVPIFGICLGHQMIGLALGGKTYKLKFGHHGGNQPVKDLRTGRVFITVQNHGFCVDEKTLNMEDIEITHINLNDGTLEGLRHRKMPLFSVQFHPEYGPGPRDSEYLFEEFVAMMEEEIAKKN